MVRESMPLFVKDAMWAAGSPMAGEDSLDDQDLQQLEEPTQAAGAAGRLLTHGGPQRVALGGYGSSQYSMLTPVAEGFTTSPIPEE